MMKSLSKLWKDSPIVRVAVLVCSILIVVLAVAWHFWPGAPTECRLAVSASQIDESQQATFTAEVLTKHSPHPPSGVVSFQDGASDLGTRTLSLGKASFQTRLSAGDHQVRAVFQSDNLREFANSESKTVGIKVTGGSTRPQVGGAGGSSQAHKQPRKPAGSEATEVEFDTAAVNTTVGNRVAVTATVKTRSGQTGNGSVVFNVIESQTILYHVEQGLDPSGVATFEFTPDKTGEFSIEATFPGTDTQAGSSRSVSLTVKTAPAFSLVGRWSIRADGYKPNNDEMAFRSDGTCTFLGPVYRYTYQDGVLSLRYRSDQGANLVGKITNIASDRNSFRFELTGSTFNVNPWQVNTRATGNMFTFTRQ